MTFSSLLTKCFFLVFTTRLIVVTLSAIHSNARTHALGSSEASVCKCDCAVGRRRLRESAWVRGHEWCYDSEEGMKKVGCRPRVSERERERVCVCVSEEAAHMYGIHSNPPTQLKMALCHLLSVFFLLLQHHAALGWHSAHVLTLILDCRKHQKTLVRLREINKRWKARLRRWWHRDTLGGNVDYLLRIGFHQSVKCPWLIDGLWSFERQHMSVVCILTTALAAF